MRLGNLYIAVFTLVLISACQRPTDWYPYYESEHKEAYGTKVFQEQLENIFPSATTEIVKERTDELLTNQAYELSTYMYVNPYFYPDSAEYKQLERFAISDNALFIVTSDDNAQCLKDHDITLAQKEDSVFRFTLTKLDVLDQEYELASRTSSVNYFKTIPSYASVIGTVTVGDSTFPNFIAIRLGGYNNKLYLHAQPDVYSNYHMLKDQDGLYALNTLSYLKYNTYFLWDGYGTQRRYTTPPSDGDTEGLLRYVFGSKSLTYALITLAALLLLFFGFNYKRITRAIPILRPERNNSIDFMKMVSNLFVAEENQIAVAKYRANFILDRIKEKYFLDTAEINEDFRKALATKTQVEEQQLRSFVAQLNKIKNSNYLDKAGFIRFSEAIEKGISLIKLNQ